MSFIIFGPDRELNVPSVKGLSQVWARFGDEHFIDLNWSVRAMSGACACCKDGDSRQHILERKQACLLDSQCEVLQTKMQCSYFC